MLLSEEAGNPRATHRDGPRFLVPFGEFEACGPEISIHADSAAMMFSEEQRSYLADCFKHCFGVAAPGLIAEVRRGLTVFFERGWSWRRGPNFDEVHCVPKNALLARQNLPQ